MRLLLAALLALTGASALACPQRGDLDTRFCDADGDLTADPPADPKALRDPPSLMLSYSPQEDAASYESLWAPYVAHMAGCIGRPVRFLAVQTSAAVVEAFRSGRIQFSMLATGDTPFAVNVAGALPYAGIGSSAGLLQYRVVVLVKAGSALRTLADLKGKRVAHSSPSSNSGNLAPRALFPQQGLVPERDYKVIYSGKHDHSIIGVQRGDYDAAVIADDVLTRMAQRGVVREADFRVIYTSAPFPSGSMVMAHDLHPALAKKIRDCTLSYRFGAELQGAFHGADRYVTMNYKRDFATVRAVAKAALAEPSPRK